MKPPFPLENSPQLPGIYLYKDDRGTVIYVGKAKNLRKRISQYFYKEQLDDKTAQLVQHIKDVEFIITKNEDQALLLEANLIREKQPKYNIDLKGGRRYAYIVLTAEKFPRLLTARDQKIKGDYFGPFVRAQLRHALLNTLRKSFFIRTCSTLPKKECLRYHIGLCKAPCIGGQSTEDYAENSAKVKAFLQGKNKALIKELQQKMIEFSIANEFEHAKELRDQIRALEYLQVRQVIEREEHIVEDVINFVHDEKQVHILVFNVRNGILGEKEELTLPYTQDFFDEFLRRYYEDQKELMPRAIVVPQVVEESTAKYLSTLAGRHIEVIHPLRGARKDLLLLAGKNLESSMKQPLQAQSELKKMIGLESVPRVLECFDISHLSGTDTVASMVQFVDGKPHKKEYRRFKISSVDGIDDFRSMQEVVRRRYKRLVDEDKALPDLVVIDGGAEQLHFACKALEEAGVEIPIIALAKKNEEIYVPGGRLPRRYDNKSEMMKLLISLRDEAHRFAVSYQRLLRSKRLQK